MTVQLLSLDLATVTGWCCGDTEAGDPVSGVYRAPNAGVDLGPFLTGYANWLNTTCEKFGVDFILYEEPIGPIANTQKATLMKLYNLAGTTERVAHYRRIRYRSEDAGTWKKSFCGNGGFGKPKTKADQAKYPPIVKCREYGWKVEDNNEADARGLWLHGCRSLSPHAAGRFDPLFRVAA